MTWKTRASKNKEVPHLQPRLADSGKNVIGLLSYLRPVFPDVITRFAFFISPDPTPYLIDLRGPVYSPYGVNPPVDRKIWFDYFKKQESTGFY